MRFELGEGFHTWTSQTGLGSCELPCTVTFPTPGEHAYACGIHPSMQGVVRVLGEPVPDLVAIRVGGASQDPAAVEVSYAVDNRGLAEAGAFAVRVEAFDDGAWQALGEARHERLAVGARATGAFAWADGLRVGAFDARVRVDTLDEVAEANEANNVATGRAAFVTDAAPGLRVPLT